MKRETRQNKLILQSRRIINFGMSQYNKVLAGDNPDMDLVQNKLIRRLDQLVPTVSRHFNPSRLNEANGGGSQITNLPSSDDVPGICRYLLTCWLDELFVFESPWSRRWNENKLELALYGTNDRAWRFWDYVHCQPAGSDYQLKTVAISCVLYGFQGQMAESRTELNKWYDDWRTDVIQHSIESWNAPPDLPIAANVPALKGSDELELSIKVALLTAIVMIPMMSFLILYALRT